MPRSVCYIGTRKLAAVLNNPLVAVLHLLCCFPAQSFELLLGLVVCIGFDLALFLKLCDSLLVLPAHLTEKSNILANRRHGKSSLAVSM